MLDAPTPVNMNASTNCDKETSIAVAEERKSEELKREEEKIEADYKFFDYLEKKNELEDEKNAAIEMGEYDIGQEEGELNWFPSQPPRQPPTLMASTYWHEGECTPSKSKCQYCYKYWCGKCGNGVTNYMSGCCSSK